MLEALQSSRINVKVSAPSGCLYFSEHLTERAEVAGPRGLVLGRERCGTEHGMYEARGRHFTTRVDSNAININGEGRYLVTDSSL